MVASGAHLACLANPFNLLGCLVGTNGTTCGYYGASGVEASAKQRKTDGPRVVLGGGVCCVPDGFTVDQGVPFN